MPHEFQRVAIVNRGEAAMRLAYVLLQMLQRLGLERTELAKAQCATIRLKLLEIGALIHITVRKVGLAWRGDIPMRSCSGRLSVRGCYRTSTS